MMNSINSKRYIFFLTPFLVGMGLSLFVVLSPARNMALWEFRHLSVNVLFSLLVFQLLVTLWNAFLRHWLDAVLCMVLVVFMVCALLMATFSVGPSLSSVKQKVVHAVGCSTSQVLCVGGFLRHEPPVVFRLDADIQLGNSFHETYNAKENITGIANTLNILEISNAIKIDGSVQVMESQLEFDRILAVYDRGGWFLLFYGND